MDYKKESLKRHLKNKGKLETRSKFPPIKTKDDLSIAYTPGVAAVSSFLAKNPKEASNYSIKGNTIAVVSDGSAVLGLGNIGPYGALPVMEGKAVLFKEFGGVDAYPIVLATQDTEEIIAGWTACHSMVNGRISDIPSAGICSINQCRISQGRIGIKCSPG